MYLLKMKICQTNNYLKNYTNQLLQKFFKKAYWPFIDNIWGAYLADRQLISKFNKGNKKSIIITNAFQNFDEYNRKSNKIWVDKGSDFTIDQ